MTSSPDPVDSFALPRRKAPPVTLFNGSQCWGCALFVVSNYSGPGSCWGASEHIDREITETSLEDFFPDGVSREGDDHDFVIVTFRYHADAPNMDGIDEGGEWITEDYIGVDPGAALGHLRGTSPLWTERVDCPFCGHTIDPERCVCGERMEADDKHEGHDPRPAGCTCSTSSTVLRARLQ